MSFFTMQLREVLASGLDIGLKDYPIWKESYRSTLNQYIIDHFYFREISAETPALFIFFLNRKMREIMPYYNQLFLSEEKEYDPLITQAYSTDHTKENNDKTQDDHTGSHTTDNQGTYDRKRDETDDETRTETWKETGSHTDNHTDNSFSESRGVSSQTPQQQVALSGIVYSALYATDGSTGQSEGANVSEDTGTYEKDTTGNIARNLTVDETIGDKSTASEQHGETAQNKHYGDHYEKYHQGVNGLNTTSPANLIQDWRDTFLNIIEMIFDDLEPLFQILYM